MKTLLIAHRGNILGPDEKKENKPDYIINSIKEGFDCEIDLRYDNLSNQFYLGHDSNQYKISKEWLLEYKDNLWIHCKDFDSLNILSLFDEAKAVSIPEKNADKIKLKAMIKRSLDIDIIKDKFFQLSLTEYMTQSFHRFQIHIPL